ncbi:hypothetical protein [Haloechinothrix halophila]|uniref:hypothetical protein n=1 Tax=Haloechinothrix halophila TaxID=1069073 RepID=UPI00040D70B4|nr:hypothetical protein [Haloechinothrix halophila]
MRQTTRLAGLTATMAAGALVLAPAAHAAPSSDITVGDPGIVIDLFDGDDLLITIGSLVISIG